MGKIVVGVDGSEPSLKALQWAVKQAALTGDSVEAVIGWELPAAGWAVPAGMPEDFDPEALGTMQLDEALAKALEPEAAEAVTKVVVVGSPAQALLDRSEGAELLVVGARGHGALKAALLGSVSLQVAQHASCPVTVLRG
ncbi:universal stress protein [Streptomyces sp. NBC_01465]|uniref:universal stress protein n=1 Tax=Streptomyces sp. NBC_01465 TaxID=2903878 RepID=UPI002E2F5389|nr:universal stress protein [Streptomyces sp. NBC_01465]